MPSLKNLMRGYGYEPFTLEGHDPATMHQKAAAVFDKIFDRIAEIQKARARGRIDRSAGMADADHAHAEGLDRTEGSGRQAG